MSYDDDAYLQDRRCCVPDCGRLIVDTSTIPTCYRCGLEIARAFTDRILADETRRRDEVRRRQIEHSANDRGETEVSRDSVVYYVRIGGYIKIGYTTKLRERMRSLRVDPDALLAIEPGGRDEERRAHAWFAPERIGRWENFEPSARLLAHVEALREQYDLPRWASLPVTDRVTRRTLPVQGA